MRRASKRRFAFVVVALVWVSPLSAQTVSPEANERARAFELYRSSRFPEALPLLEKLHATNPDDSVVLEALAFATLGNAAVLPDESARRQGRARARKLAEDARKLGDDSNLLKILLTVPEDGTEPPYSNKADVEAAMREGESFFARGDFDSAAVAYQKALALDPTQYFAALFIGDTLFKRRDFDQAASWFRRAVQINVNGETAYRYWGDALVAQNRMSEAAEKFIAAIVAEPYIRTTWAGLAQWAEKQQMAIAHPMIELREPGQDENRDGASPWTTYQRSRASWRAEKFKQVFPTESDYRHSLREEVESLRAVVNLVKQGLEQKPSAAPDPSLAALVSLSDDGLLESFVLISRADEGIFKDYSAYRNAEREKIARYIAEWVIHPSLRR